MRLNLDSLDAGLLGLSFGIPEARFLRTVPVHTSPVTITRIVKSMSGDAECRISLPECDAYLLMIYLEDTIHSDVLADGSLAQPRLCGKGSVCIVDLRQGASVVLHRDLSSLAVYLPKALIKEVADVSFPEPQKSDLRCRRAEPDQVVSSLAAVILSFFDRDRDAIEPLLKHLSVAICVHLLQDGLDAVPAGNSAILPLDRELAAKEFMRANLGREVTVAEIAAATGLSAILFARGFKNVTGLTPHQWLVQARVDAARGLLAEHRLSLKEVARACGFVDQSHFTKVFCREVGDTPAQWRRRQLH